MRRRRRPSNRRLLPWFLALAVVAGVGLMLHRALVMSDEQLVELAELARKGDLEREIPGDPGAALQMLGPLLDRHPEHVEANFAAARAWADLRSWTRAIEHLERAEAGAEELPDKIRARRLVVTLRTREQRYDLAVDEARKIIELDPENRLLPLQYGLALYDASVGMQADVTRVFIKGSKGVEDTINEERIEKFVTDIWGKPDVAELLGILAPKANPSLRKEISSQLMAAHDQFCEAAEVMADFRDYPGFDPTVAKGYVELLLRSGRVYEAHIESAIALRHPGMPNGMRKAFQEIQARCSKIVGEYGIAADLYQLITDDIIAKQGWAPPLHVNDLVEARVLAEDWDWIRSHYADLRAMNKKDTLYVDYAYAAALHAEGRDDEALSVLKQPFSTISLATLVPLSVRSYPERRRAVLSLAYELFNGIGETSALSALDAMLDLSADDLEARRLRIEVNLGLGGPGRVEAAKDDAFDLLISSRRNHEDFELWQGISDQLSLQRYGRSLAERAVALLDKERSLRQSNDEAELQRIERGRGPQISTRRGVEATLPQDVSLAWAIVKERMRRNDLERARIELRQLSDSHPDVQEFRFQLGRLLVREGKLLPAVTEFRRLLRDVPSDTETLDLCMRLERSLGRHKEAAELVNEMILQDPLGVGAVRFGQKLLDTNRPDMATELLQRLMRWQGFDPGLDVYLLAARAALAMRDYAGASELLVTLASSYPDSADVALLGLEIGLASHDDNVTLSAIAYLQPMATGLLPDQVELLAQTLIESRMHQELLTLFAPEVRQLPVVVPALRALAAASKAVGDPEEADRLLERLDDADSLRDRFLLLALDDRTDEATRRLRLQSVAPGRRAELELCLDIGSVLQGFTSFQDDKPVARLRELGMNAELDNAGLELLDAALRLHPAVKRLEEVVPQQILTQPRAVYPNAGPDVAQLVTIAHTAPAVAEEVTRSLILTLLAGDRPFWSRETLQLNAHILARAPTLRVPALMLAHRALDEGRPSQALDALARLMDAEAPDPALLPVFLEALQQLGHEEWGLAVALEAEQSVPGILIATADALAGRGLFDQALARYSAFLADHPEDARALGGLIGVQANLHLTDAATASVRQALRDHPDDLDLARVCADALITLPRPTPDAIGVIDLLLSRFPEAYELYEAKAKALASDRPRLAVTLGELLGRMRQLPVVLGSAEARQHAALLRRASSLAATSDLSSLARDFSELALRFEPGVVVQYRELAELEIEEGNLDTGRRYLEVLSIVNPNDRDPSLALAGLLFMQIGQPHRAAEVIRRAYGNSPMPPGAVEVLAAESYLKGDAAGAVEAFMSVRHSPLITADTFLTVGRIAFASGIDDLADAVFDLFLDTCAPDHPGQGRVRYLARQLRVPGKPGTPAEPDGEGPSSASDGADEPAEASELDARVVSDEPEAVTDPVGAPLSDT